MKRVYLDHNATTPLRPEARSLWLAVSQELAGNPSSLHAEGRRARDLVDRARQQVAAALGAHEEEVIFTSGGTEASNIALRGVLAAASAPSALATGATEHSAVLETARALEQAGHPLRVLPVDELGRPRLAALAEVLERGVADPSGARVGLALVSLQAANNEIGTVVDLPHVAEVLRTSTSGRGVLLHTDAVQALGRLPIELERWGVDLASFSAHKVGGPVGVGILWKRRGVRLVPLTTGGGHEGGLRAGTEDVAGICAAALAVERAVQEQEELARRTRELCTTLWRELAASLPGLRLLGPPVGSGERLPNTLSFLVPGEDGKVLVTRLDLEGVAIGAGSACASGSLEPSHVLLALGCSADEARAGLRVSLGRDTTYDECRVALAAFRKHLVVARPSRGASGA